MLNIGFEVLDTNYYTKYGEIDIIAMKDNTYHFIEVKSIKKDSYIDPIYKINRAKLSKIYRSILIYISSKNINTGYCIDVIIVRGNNIDFIKNVTM